VSSNWTTVVKDNSRLEHYSQWTFSINQDNYLEQIFTAADGG